MLGTWMRNVILNQTIVGMIFVSILLLCQSALLPLVNMVDADDGIPFFVAGGLVLFLACLSMAMNVVSEAPPDEVPQTWFQRWKCWFRRVQVTATVMVPFVAACVLLNCALWQKPFFADRPLGWWAVAGGGFYLVSWGIVGLIVLARRFPHRLNPKPRKMVSVVALFLFSPVAGAVGGCLMYAYILLLRHIPSYIDSSTEWVAVVFGSGVVMTNMLLVGVLHLGLVGRGSMDLVREWWARLGGYLMLITLGWLLLAGVTAFAPLGVRWLFTFKLPSMAAIGLWILHNFLGVKAASSARTSGKNTADPNATKNGDANDGAGQGAEAGSWLTRFKSPKVLSVVARVAPYVFIVGLVLLLSTGVHIATSLAFNFEDATTLWNVSDKLPLSALSEQYWDLLREAPKGWLPCIGGIFFLTALALSWRVDVNDFSLHHFYRNRLVRCYLGASNPERKPEPFTGFDAGDDVALCELADNYPGPYPILNAALNITGGEELGYATRRAKSFAFTPLYCGYELSASGEGMQRFSSANGYLPSYAKTEQGRSGCGIGKFGSEGGISLGTAMAISGAAASPNMGYHTAPATAFFMALFDVRLGWWMGNSRDPKKWKSTGPPLGLGYLFSEVFAQSDQQKGYVYLSDGGHFENLAVYELIRRRCRLIVACDADADGAYAFDDLLSLIEKARTDFGAHIEIDYSKILPTVDRRQCPQNCVVGTIYYDAGDRDDTGTLILIKAGMPLGNAPPSPCSPANLNLPADVWRYYRQHQTFPHESTADQWFDEYQFESYRALGEFIGCHAADEINAAIEQTLARGKTREVQVEASPERVPQENLAALPEVR